MSVTVLETLSRRTSRFHPGQVPTNSMKLFSLMVNGDESSESRPLSIRQAADRMGISVKMHGVASDIRVLGKCCWGWSTKEVVGEAGNMLTERPNGSPRQPAAPSESKSN